MLPYSERLWSLRKNLLSATNQIKFWWGIEHNRTRALETQLHCNHSFKFHFWCNIWKFFKRHYCSTSKKIGVSMETRVLRLFTAEQHPSSRGKDWYSVPAFTLPQLQNSSWVVAKYPLSKLLFTPRTLRCLSTKNIRAIPNHRGNIRLRYGAKHS